MRQVKSISPRFPHVNTRQKVSDLDETPHQREVPLIPNKQPLGVPLIFYLPDICDFRTPNILVVFGTLISCDT